ncbi:MAG: DUF2029 domain-containing protein [Acidobacteriota bacterium]|nr:DUF2029 domain-containing protein [Acidobacteriota bacterium]
MPLWILIALSLPVWIGLSTPGWDLKIYQTAIHSLQAGHDPYVDATGIQKLAYSRGPIPPHRDPPFTYNYPPVTLLVLALAGRIPSPLAAFAYWCAYAVAILIQIGVSLTLPEAGERRIFRFVAPLTVFFPGLLADGTVLSGNIAHILYGAMLLSAVVGWRRDRWRWFYLATLIASCFKLPFLTFLLIPVFSSERQWLPAAMTALGGVVVAFAQPFLYPQLSFHYIESVELMFSLTRDFGCGPAGIFSQWLVAHHHPYTPGGLLFYLAYAAPVVVFLFVLSRRYIAGSFPLKQWLPVLLLGTVLLNPRLIEYDVVPVTLPMALILWRVTTRFTSARRAAAGLLLCVGTCNVIGLSSWSLRKIVDCPLLVLTFVAGSWLLLHQRPAIDPLREEWPASEFEPEPLLTH